VHVVLDRVRQELVEGRAELPEWGSVVEGRSAVPPWLLLDEDGCEVEPVTSFLRDLTLSDCSLLTVRSYAFDLLRWWRLLRVVEVSWDRATRGELELLVGWMRSARNPQRYRQRPDAPAPGSVNPVSGKQALRLGYAPRTINHQLSVLSSFYAFHAVFGRGPVINPVPSTKERRDRLAHRSPIEAQAEHRRAPLRQKVPAQNPRSIPDERFDELFARMGNHRDRALLTLFVSTGGRAAEVLGLQAEHVDWAGQQVLVTSKGSRLVEPVPASPQALRFLALYYDEHGTPAAGEAVFRTIHGPTRALSYSAARRVLQRANAVLGSDWSLHDLRHTLIERMTSDPALTLSEVMAVTRHRRVESMTPYLRPRVEEMFDKLQAHYTQPRPTQTYTPGYDADDVSTVFGTVHRG
jgi:integrase